MSPPTTAREYRIPTPGDIEDCLILQDGDVPTLTMNNILVKIHAVSLNYRDLMVIDGVCPGTKGNLIPCSDAAGEVVAVGDEVTKWNLGDRVMSSLNIAHIYGSMSADVQTYCLGSNIDGVLAEYRVFPAEALVRVPDHLTYEQAATLPCAAVTAWHALQGPVPLRGGDYVLVQGTGGVSVFGIQIAQALGAIVIATSSSDEKLEVAKQLGAHHFINYTKTPDWDQEVLRITGGRGVDHVIEVGGPGTLLKSIAASRYSGWIHNIGLIAGLSKDVPALQVTGGLLMKEITFRSILVGAVAHFEDMSRLFSIRKIVPRVDKVFDFTEAKEAYKYLRSQKHIGKVVISIADS